MTTFPRFAELPVELQLSIWQYSLPPPVRSTLFPFVKSNWCIRRLQGSDTDPFLEGIEEYTWNQGAYGTIIPTPQATVNHLSRKMLLKWVEQQPDDLKRGGSSSSPFYRQSFHLFRDALFVPLDQWSTFIEEHHGHALLEVEAGYSRSHRPMWSSLAQLAVPDSLLQDETALKNLLQYLCGILSVQKVFVVVDPPEELSSGVSKGDKEPSRWEFESLRQDAYVRKMDPETWTWPWSKSEGEIQQGNEGLHARIWKTLITADFVAALEDRESNIEIMLVSAHKA